MLESALQSVFYGRILPNCVSGAVSVLIILAFRQLTRRWTKDCVCMLWMFLLAQMLIPPLFQSSFYTVRDAGTEYFKTELKNAGNMQAADPPIQPEMPGVSNPAESGYMPDNGQFQPSLADADVPDADVLPAVWIWAVRLWLAGIFLLTIYFIYLYVRLKRRVCGAVRCAEGYWQSGAVTVPFVMPGILPRIYLPADIALERRDDLLAHERQHIRNLDPWLKCIALATAVVYWFHPLIWLAVSLYGKDMEMYCDECVLKGKDLARRKAYAGTLLEFASERSGFPLAVNFAKSNTQQRIAHILHVKKPRFALRFVFVIFVFLCGQAFLSAKNIEEKTQQIPDGDIRTLPTGLFAEKFASAVSFKDYQSWPYEARGKGAVVLLQSLPDADVSVYGYDGADYGLRGIAVDIGGTYSFFDLPWDDRYFQPKLYQGDYDGDGAQELALVVPSFYGNGISLEGLFVFDARADGTLSYSRLPSDDQEYLRGRLEPFIQYEKADGIVRIVTDGETKKTVDFTRFPDYGEWKGKLKLSYTTDIRFAVEGSRLMMLADIQRAPEGTLDWLDTDGSDTTAAFDISYAPEGFRFAPAD